MTRAELIEEIIKIESERNLTGVFDLKIYRTRIKKYKKEGLERTLTHLKSLPPPKPIRYMPF